jgi:hypothetical protein
MIKLIIEGEEYVFKGDELTSPISEALLFLKDKQEREMVV